MLRTGSVEPTLRADPDFRNREGVLMGGPRIVVLTGAGISAESGISTFRDANGLWKSRSISELASPRGYALRPDVVLEFYDARRRQALAALPNAAHYAISDLSRELRTDGDRRSVLVVTQNVDDLHERAGSNDVIHLHGELNSTLCAACGEEHHWEGDLRGGPPCPSCGRKALRPNVVWFGENVRRLREAETAIDQCEILIVVGTSGSVWPAAGLIERARSIGVETVLANAEPWENSTEFDRVLLGPATQTVPDLVTQILEDDFDPDSDWSETSPTLQRTSVYIDFDSTITNRMFPLGSTASLPGLMPGARDAVRQLSRNLNVVIVADDRIAASPFFARFWDWYTVHLGSHRGHLVDQLLLTGDKQRLRGWDYFVVGADAGEQPSGWVGEILRLQSPNSDWPGAVAHILVHASRRSPRRQDARKDEDWTG